MEKLLVFHFALAPYRVDFFNSLSSFFDSDIVFLSRNVRDQPFNQTELIARCSFRNHYLDSKIVCCNRDLNFGYLRYINSFNPNVIIGGEFGLPTLLPYIYKVLFKKKYRLYTICDDSINIAEQCSGIRKLLRNYLVKRLNGIIFISDEVAKWYRENLNPELNALTFPIIRKDDLYSNKLISIKDISKSYINKYHLQGCKLVLFVGRLVHVKNLKRLITAFANQQSNNARLVLVGDGELKNELRSLTIELNIEDKVLFVGRFEGDDLLAWYNLANVFVLPSLSEPFGAVTAEALQAGCPVLCSCFAGSSTLIEDNVNGNVFNPNQKDCLEKLLEKYIDTPLINLADNRASLLSTSFNEYMNKLVIGLKK